MCVYVRVRVCARVLAPHLSKSSFFAYRALSASDVGGGGRLCSSKASKSWSSEHVSIFASATPRSPYGRPDAAIPEAAAGEAAGRADKAARVEAAGAQAAGAGVNGASTLILCRVRSRSCPES